MIRDLQIVVDRASWTGGRVPPQTILNIAKTTRINVLFSLVHTALWTRPPVIRGFHLNDYWAWLRYGPALANTPDLRLCDAWDDVDAHQKTLLSDELGVGVTTNLLADGLRCREFVDTLYVIKTLRPGLFTLGRTSRRGPDKSPDYIATDDQGRFIILECKGTQSSRQALADAIARGIPQKRNVQAQAGTRIYLALVGGLFVPQSRSTEAALVYFSDPWWEDIVSIFEEPVDLHGAITQIHMAKIFAIAGMARTAEALALTPLQQLGEMPQGAKRELQSHVQSLETEWVCLDTMHNNGLMSVPKARLSITFPSDLIRTLLDTKDLRKSLHLLNDAAMKKSWEHEALKETAVCVTAPYGYKLVLEYGKSKGLDDIYNDEKRI
jgi:hypothetical protein